MLVSLSAGLAERGVEVEVWHFGNDWLAAQCAARGVAHTVLPGLADYKSKYRLPRAIRDLSSRLRQRRVDVLHAHLFGAVWSGALAARLAGVRSIGTLHDSYTVTERPARIRLLQAAALLGTPLVAVAASMESLFRAMAHFGRHAWTTIHNGVDTELFQPRPGALTRADLRLPGDRILIGCVGRLVPLKRHARLIETVAALDREDTSLVIVGEGPEMSRLQALVRAKGVAGAVHFLGQRDDVAAILPLLDLFALFSDTEGLSCSIAEALACGLPCVVTDVGGNSELIRHGEEGLLVPPSDRSAAGRYLGSLVQDREFRNRMRLNARARAVEHFSLHAMLAAYERMLRPAAVANAA